MGYEFNQAPKSWEEQSSGFKLKYLDFHDLDPQRFVAQPKVDGCMAIIDTVGNRVLSRQGKLVKSMPHILAELQAAFPGMVIFGEAIVPGRPFAEGAGVFRKLTPQPTLSLVAFDMVPHQAWLDGFCALPYSVRYKNVAREEMGEEYWSTVRIEPLPADVQSRANQLVQQGGHDGLIVRDLHAGWETGASKQGEAIKVQPNISLSLQVVGTEPGKGKHAGKVGALVVRLGSMDGQHCSVGTGLSDKDRARTDWLGKIVEVEAMGWTPDGKLREPRLKGIRDDAAPDF